MKICAGGGGRSEPASASRDALPSTYSRTLDASLSSATIPDDMTMSTCSVLDRLGPGDAGEKESLVRRLRELVLSEETEVDRNLAEAKQRLSRVEAEYARSVNELKQEAAKEEENLLKAQREEFALLQSTQAKEEERIEREIRKLEAELESILAPAKMLASLRNTASIAEVRSHILIFPVTVVIIADYRIIFITNRSRGRRPAWPRRRSCPRWSLSCCAWCAGGCAPRRAVPPSTSVPRGTSCARSAATPQPAAPSAASSSAPPSSAGTRSWRTSPGSISSVPKLNQIKYCTNEK